MGQAMIEWALTLPLLTLLLIGGLDVGLMLDGKLVGASAAREGARVAAILGDGSHQTAQPVAGSVVVNNPLTQEQVDYRIAITVLTSARHIPSATLDYVDIYRVPPEDTSSDGSFSPTDHYDRWRLGATCAGLPPCPDPAQQSFILQERRPDAAEIGVELHWHYAPPAQPGHAAYDLSERAVARTLPWFTPGVPAKPPLSFVSAGCAMFPGMTFPRCVHATFYHQRLDTSTFGTTSGPIWTQDFGEIDFNPPAGAAIGCGHTGVDDATRPFANIRPLVCLPPEPAQNADGSIKAGYPCPPVDAFPCTFAATFVSTIHVEPGQLPADGNIEFHLYSDDGWILGFGPNANGQPQYVSGSSFPAPLPPATFERGYPVVGAYNWASAPTLNTVRVHFPGPGDYPVEVDYTETFGQRMALVFGSQFGEPVPEAPAP